MRECWKIRSDNSTRQCYEEWAAYATRGRERQKRYEKCNLAFRTHSLVCFPIFYLTFPGAIPCSQTSPTLFITGNTTNITLASSRQITHRQDHCRGFSFRIGITDKPHISPSEGFKHGINHARVAEQTHSIQFLNPKWSRTPPLGRMRP